MAGEAYLAVARAHRDLYTRYAFYLLAVVGAAVGFALNQTQGAVLAWSQVPLGLAISSWFLSFYFGLRQLKSVLATLLANSLLLAVEDGHHPELPNSPETRAKIMKKIEQSGKHAGRLSELQVWALLIGVFFYVSWHVLEMYLRQHSSS